MSTYLAGNQYFATACRLRQRSNYDFFTYRDKEQTFFDVSV